MTQLYSIYKCEVCGNIVQVVHQGQGTLVCCGKEMVTMIEQGEGEYAEKHAPVIEDNLVKIGTVEHPMEEDHYIEWIEAISESGEHSKIFLKPGQKPQAEFCFKPVEARMYCNKHGLWINKKS